ncbi:hypothetical protein EDB89DRAFT_1915309 [Lactarius sanguifluus]|nr:hypothetical protein EDB89DRAFT_1915309 [Lactarius sanguifluus]
MAHSPACKPGNEGPQMPLLGLHATHPLQFVCDPSPSPRRTLCAQLVVRWGDAPPPGHAELPTWLCAAPALCSARRVGGRGALRVCVPQGVCSRVVPPFAQVEGVRPLHTYQEARPRGVAGRCALVRPPPVCMGKGREGGGAPTRAPFPRVESAVAKGGGTGGEGGRRALMRPLPREWEGEGPGSSALACSLSARCHGQRGRGWGDIPLVEGANEGAYLSCTRLRAKGGGKWGPTIPAPVPPLRENRGGGSKVPFPFARKRRRGCKGGPVSVLGRTEAGKGAGKGGAPRKEAKGGWEGPCGVRQRGEVRPPRGPVQGTQKGGA